MTPPPDVLVMDLGGVTCRWLPDRRLTALSELCGLPAETIDQLVFESGFDDAGERGRFKLDEFTAELLGLLGLSPTTELRDAARAAWATAFEPDARVLKLIRDARCPSALFTNNGPLLEAGLVEDLTEVGSTFDQLLFSWRLGTTKPDPAAFARAAERLGVDPARILFVDDSADNAKAAEAAGWQAHRYTNSLNLHAALSEAGLL
ncbi:MAG TPA: HAD-IA family hydrolase [Acidimicrobiales bacterium]|jgi:HAD superfamily hydrolase (TIGR01509 family)|nr:HAD-IA family hydrolase [Acidimicrobiales bacterium]